MLPFMKPAPAVMLAALMTTALSGCQEDDDDTVAIRDVTSEYVVSARPMVPASEYAGAIFAQCMDAGLLDVDECEDLVPEVTEDLNDLPEYSTIRACESAFGMGGCEQTAWGITPILTAFIAMEVIDEIGDTLKRRGSAVRPKGYAYQPRYAGRDVTFGTSRTGYTAPASVVSGYAKSNGSAAPVKAAPSAVSLSKSPTTPARSQTSDVDAFLTTSKTVTAPKAAAATPSVNGGASGVSLSKTQTAPVKSQPSEVDALLTTSKTVAAPKAATSSKAVPAPKPVATATSSTKSPTTARKTTTKSTSTKRKTSTTKTSSSSKKKR